MARVKRVSSREVGPLMKVIFYFTQHNMAKLAGRETGDMLEPLEVYANIPGLLRGYASLEKATAKLHYLNKRLKYLAELKAATLTNCEYCIDLGSAVARRSGLSDEQLLDLAAYHTSSHFSDLEKLVLDYSVAMSQTPVAVTDALFEQLRQHFNEVQLVELTHIIALENHRGRFNLSLGIGATGFSEGMVCAMPVAATQAKVGADRLSQ